MNEQYKINVLTHLYYEDSYMLIKDHLKNLKNHNSFFLFNISQDSVNKKSLIPEIQLDFPESIIIEAPNIGKDIGGKLALIDLQNKLNIQSEYSLFLHDKLSPQTLNGKEWRNKLFRIIQKENIESILNVFANDASIGVIGSKDCISNEYSAEIDNFLTVNNDLLKNYILQYNIKTANYDFVAGTMFWIKSSIIKDFFGKHNPIEMRKNLEHGNVLDNLKGTHAHTIERLMGFIAGNYGYKVYGI